MIELSKPIWLNQVQENQYIEAKQTFDIPSLTPIVKGKKGNGVQDNCLMLEICSDAEYVVYINNRFVGTGQYHTYSNRKVYDTYDIYDFVKVGTNEIYVVAYYHGKEAFQYSEGIPMLMYAVGTPLTSADKCVIYASSSEATLLRQHPYYVSGTSVDELNFQLGYTFRYDATMPQTQWQKASILQNYTPNLEPRSVKQLHHEPLANGTLISQGELLRKSEGTIAEMMQHDFLSYREKEEIIKGNVVSQKQNGVYLIYDIGMEYAGLLNFNIKGAKGTIIDIGYGEHLDDMRVRTSVGGRNYAFRYVVGVETDFVGYFRRVAGQYIALHITNMQGDLSIDNVGIIPTVYPVDKINKPTCHDKLFQRLCDVSIDTLRLCMHEHYEDCPYREQSLYALDSYIQMLSGYYAFGNYTFARESLRLLAESQMDNGLFELCAPSHYKVRTIPSFSLAWILSLESYANYSGDLDFVKSVINVATRVLDFFKVKDGLVQIHKEPYYWNFYEWTDGLHGGYEITWKSEAPIQFYYIMACEAYNRLCAKLNIAAYDVDLLQLREAAYDAFYDKNNDVYLTRQDDCRIHELTQALSYLAGAKDSDKAVIKLSDENDMIKATLSTSLFKYEALLSQGDKYKAFVINDIAKIWGKMLFAGASTLWETSDGAGAFGNAGSLCHGWSAVPLYLIFKYKLDV